MGAYSANLQIVDLLIFFISREAFIFLDKLGKDWHYISRLNIFLKINHLFFQLKVESRAKNVNFKICSTNLDRSNLINQY